MKPEQRFATLSAFAFYLRVLGIVAFLIGFFAALDAVNTAWLAAVISVAIGIAAFFLCLLIAELVEVALAIEKHTRDTREGIWTLVRDLRND